MKLPRAIGAIALIIIALPIALIAGIAFRGRKCTPDKLASELERLANGDMRDWDQLERVSMRDARLEAIRREAMEVALPFRPQDRELMVRLAAKAAALPSLE